VVSTSNAILGCEVRGLTLVSHQCTGFEFFNRQFAKLEGTSWAMSQGTSNFIAGGMASNGEPSATGSPVLEHKLIPHLFDLAFWAAALPADNVKNRIMADGLSQSRYKGIVHAFKTILHEKDLTSRSRMGNLLVGGSNFYRVSSWWSHAD